MQTSENLFLAREYLRLRSTKELSDSDENAANHIYAWASQLALPSAIYAETLDEHSGRRA